MDRVSHILTNEPHNPERYSATVVNKFRKEDAKARTQIVFNFGEEPNKLVTSIIFAGDTTKEVSNNLSDAYMKEKIQPKLNLRRKL